MPHSIWSDLCKQPTQPVCTEKYTKLVYDSTTQLHQPLQSILSALDQRADALTKLANFESALDDAKVMQQILSSSPLGYIRAATIYSEQGKQGQVIDVCSKGLDLVDSNDPGYATLQQIKTVAMQHQSKRIDFISQLPTDIVASRLIPMFTDTSTLDSLQPCPYLHVSNLWRDYILQYSNGLSFKTMGGDDEPDLERCSQLIRFAPHIKTLHVHQYSQGSWLYDLLCDNDFCSLREIHIDEVYDGYMDQFVLSLRSVASTLTHLSININEDLNEMVPMAEILSICPNLVSLTMRQPDLDTFKLLPVTTWPKMTTLSIHEEGGVLNPAEVKSICRRFPSLKRLEFYPCPDIRTALMIPRCCPLLKRAQIDIDNDVVGVSYVDTDTGSGEVVVTKLSVYFEFEDDEPLEESSHILRQHHGTLEGIKWNVWLERDYDDLADIQYPHLKTLALLTYGPPLIQNAPMLEELTLSATAIDDNFAVLETIPPTLKKLKLILVEIPDEFDTRALKRCLYRVSQHCQLQDLAIRFGNSYGDPDVLAAIYHFKTLQRLMLSFCWRSELLAFISRIRTF